MDEGPRHLFNVAQEYAGEDKKVIAAAIALALHEIVLAAWEINNRLGEIRDNLEKENN